MKVLSKYNKLLLAPIVYLVHKNILFGLIQKKLIKRFNFKNFIFELNIKKIPLSVYSSFFTKTYEINDRILVQKFINEKNRCIIIGGGIGFIAVLAYHQSKSKILVFEINKNIIDNLRNNLVLNNCEFTVINKNLILDDDDKIKSNYFYGENFLETSVLEESRNIESIENINYQKISDIDDYNTLIIDGEGIEKYIIHNIDSLKKIKYIIFELHLHLLDDYETEEIFNKLNSIGFIKKFHFLSSYYFVKD